MFWPSTSPTSFPRPMNPLGIIDPMISIIQESITCPKIHLQSTLFEILNMTMVRVQNPMTSSFSLTLGSSIFDELEVILGPPYQNVSKAICERPTLLAIIKGGHSS